jgi:hypothetical protein
LNFISSIGKEKILLSESVVLLYIAGLLLSMTHSSREQNERQLRKLSKSGYLDRNILFLGVV